MRQIVEAFGLRQHFETDVVAKNLVSNYPCSELKFADELNLCQRLPEPNFETVLTCQRSIMCDRT